MKRAAPEEYVDPSAGPLFDAVAARDAAIEAVANSSAEWVAKAMPLVEALARAQAELTTDDIWASMQRTGLSICDEPRAMGALMTAACRRGWIRKTDKTKRSRRAECHARPVAIWSSKLHG